MQSDFLDRHDRIQKLGGPLQPRKPRYSSKVPYLVLLGVSVIVATAVVQCHKPQPTKTDSQCTSCHNRHAQMITYFAKAGNPTPEEMATAVLATKSPRLLAAMAVAGEKNTHYKTRRGGYKKQHAGAWQVNPRYWGPVPFDPVGQALKTEDILKDLTKDQPIEKALAVYGGDSTAMYSNRVLAELVNVP